MIVVSLNRRKGGKMNRSFSKNRLILRLQIFFHEFTYILKVWILYLQLKFANSITYYVHFMGDIICKNEVKVCKIEGLLQNS